MAKKKSRAAVELGRQGGRAKWARLTPEERAAILKALQKARWKKRKDGSS
jgi:predicted Fe-S protein YdhL (DUF1289 family)